MNPHTKTIRRTSRAQSIYIRFIKRGSDIKQKSDSIVIENPPLQGYYILIGKVHMSCHRRLEVLQHVGSRDKSKF